MNEKIIKGIIFLAGAAVGSAVTWKLVKDKYEQIANEEIKSVKEVFSKKTDEVEELVNELKETTSKAAEAVKAKDICETNGYTNYSTNKEVEEVKEETKDMPYVISPDEFGTKDDYEVISLTYYEGDKYLADDMDELVEDVEHSVGWDSLEHFGDYEDDAVHVRNDNLKADYEILKDVRNFTDVANPNHE